MQIRDACTAAGLTKKAVEYYVAQGLVGPAVHENGYRNFSVAEIDKLKRIAVLRRLGLGIEDIREVLADESGEALRNFTMRNRLRLQHDSAKQALLDQLSTEHEWEKIRAETENLDKGLAVAERLMDAFPGQYGRFMCLHFARYLLNPIETLGQQEAYEQIVRFLDRLPELEMPGDLREYLEESAPGLSASSMAEIDDKAIRSLEDIEAFLSENRETLNWYLTYKKSDEYLNSLAYRLQALLKEFNAVSGYDEVFIPAMRRLSPAYDAYCKQLEAANELLAQHYPEIQ